MGRLKSALMTMYKQYPEVRINLNPFKVECALRLPHCIVSCLDSNIVVARWDVEQETDHNDAPQFAGRQAQVRAQAIR